MIRIRFALRSAALALALTSSTATATSITAPKVPLPEGSFRVTRGLIAPWVEDGSSIDPTAWLGKTLAFSAKRFDAPAGLGCDAPGYETDWRPARGLFQGGLDEGPEEAQKLAAALALARDATPTVSLTCDTGIFDFHWATPQALMLALDNVIWVLDRSPGALAAAGTPEAQVQAFLESHFGGDMGFDVTTVKRKQAFLTAGLQERIAAYFDADFPTDEPPPINGDPITNSQEYPVLFSVGAADIAADVATVPVRYDDGYRPIDVHFVLKRGADGWLIDDLRYDGDDTFRSTLEARPEQ